MLRGLVLALSVTGALAFSAQLPVRCRLLYPCMEISLECLCLDMSLNAHGQA